MQTKYKELFVHKLELNHLTPIDFFLDSIQYGFVVTVIALLLLKRQETRFQISALIEANNFLLMMWIILHLVNEVLYLLSSWYSGGEYEQYSILNRWFGPYAVLQWLSFLFWYLPPLIMLKARHRNSLTSARFVAALWISGLFISRVLLASIREGWHITAGMDYLSVLEMILIYALLLAVTFLALKKKPE